MGMHTASDTHQGQCAVRVGKTVRGGGDTRFGVGAVGAQRAWSEPDDAEGVVHVAHERYRAQRAIGIVQGITIMRGSRRWP